MFQFFSFTYKWFILALVFFKVKIGLSPLHYFFFMDKLTGCLSSFLSLSFTNFKFGNIKKTKYPWMV